MTAFDIRITLISEDTGVPLATATREEVASAYLPRVGETIEYDGLLPRDLTEAPEARGLLGEALVVTAVSHWTKRVAGGSLRPPTVNARTRVEEGAMTFIVARLERAGWSCTRDAKTLTRLDLWAHPDRMVLAGG